MLVLTISTVLVYTTYILLDVLLCSIAEYVYELCRIWASQNTNNEYKFSAILRSKTSNKRFIIQHAKLVCSREQVSWIFNYREYVIEVCKAARNWRWKSS